MVIFNSYVKLPEGKQYINNKKKTYLDMVELVDGAYKWQVDDFSNWSQSTDVSADCLNNNWCGPPETSRSISVTFRNQNSSRCIYIYDIYIYVMMI